MNDKRRPQKQDAPRRADKFAQRTVVEEVEGQLEGRNALQEALKTALSMFSVILPPPA